MQFAFKILTYSSLNGQLLLNKLKLNQKAIVTDLIQHFEADFHWKVSLKIMNSGIILKTFVHVYLIGWPESSSSVKRHFIYKTKMSQLFQYHRQYNRLSN